MRNKLFVISLLIITFSGCGKKGPLVLEPENPSPAIVNFQVRQVGGQIELSWKFPALQTDKKEPFEIPWVSKVYVYHSMLQSEVTPPANIFFKNAKLLAKIKTGEIKGLSQNSPSCRFSFKNKELQEKSHSFVLIYYYGRRKSVPSPLQTLKTLLTPLPVQDLKVSRQGKSVILNWSKPASEDKGQSMMPITGYHIYRKINGANAEQDFRRISSETVPNEFYHDLDTGTDGEYEYQVSCRLSEQVESAPSNVVKIKVQDTFPPDIPANLVIFTAKDQIFLTWETVPDVDLAHYRVYRKSSKDPDFKLLADSVTDNFFRDKQVAKGQLYIYAISAVDKKGNESETSQPVQQLFE
jgi:hypothetical protein